MVELVRNDVSKDEANELGGLPNYNIWSLKMKAILKRRIHRI